MKRSAAYVGAWLFLAYLIGSLSLFAGTTGYASYGASNYHDAYFGTYYAAFVVMAVLSGLCAVFTVVAFFGFFAHKPVRGPLLRSFLWTSLLGHVAIWVIALVIMCVLWAIAYFIFIMVWTSLMIAIGLAALVKTNRGGSIEDYQDPEEVVVDESPASA